MEQGPVVDVNRHYANGGIEWYRVPLNFCAVGICAVYGSKVDAMLQSNVDGAKSQNLPYVTYGIPDATKDPIWWADFYLDQYGVQDAPTTIDIEPNLGYLVTAANALKARNRIAQVTGDLPWYYSNYNYTKQIGNPKWIKEMIVWWAEYLYEKYPYKYRRLDAWLSSHPWWQPKWAQTLGIAPVLHQLSDYGDAPYYLTPPSGKKSADLNVSLIDKGAFLSLFPMQPLTLEQKVAIMWEAHPELWP